MPSMRTILMTLTLMGAIQTGARATPAPAEAQGAWSAKGTCGPTDKHLVVGADSIDFVGVGPEQKLGVDSSGSLDRLAFRIVTIPEALSAEADAPLVDDTIVVRVTGDEMRLIEMTSRGKTEQMSNPPLHRCH